MFCRLPSSIASINRSQSVPIQKRGYAIVSNTTGATGQVDTLNSITAAMPPRRVVTLLPGDGIGPELVQSVVGIFQAADVPITWERFDNVFDVAKQKENPESLAQIVSSIARNRVCLKGPLYTPPGTGSRNLTLRKALDLFANVVPCTSIPSLNTRHKNVPIDLVVVRENTQGEYSGHEQVVEPGVVQSLKVVTDRSSKRIAQFAFDYAVREGRKKVTCIHKANIQKLTDGLFLRVCRETAQRYPDIKYNEMIIDNCCMQLVMNPSQFDVMVTGNLYGNLIANVGTGLVGGAGVTGGANFGSDFAIFEVGARHLGLDIAGQGKANPTGLIQSSLMMLKHMDLHQHAKRIESALKTVISVRKIWTADLGGTATTRDVTQAIINELDNQSDVD